MDTVVDRLGVRVMGTASHTVLTFILYTRFPDPTGVINKRPTRRALGGYVEPPEVAAERQSTLEELLALDRLTLAEARRKADEWLRMIARGVDPTAETARRKQAKIESRKNTFAAVFEDWVWDELSGERKRKEVEREVRREFVPKLGPRPITEITDLDILAIINAKKREAPAQARNLLGHVQTAVHVGD
jgi:Arm DNA-binding domain